jgi:membrane-bound lytic murein transglycosylase D
VRSGDNLTEIAQRYGVTVANLRAWNNLRSNTIHTGQTLKVSGNASSRAATTSRTQTYRVRSGDSLTPLPANMGLRSPRSSSGITCVPAPSVRVSS